MRQEQTNFYALACKSRGKHGPNNAQRTFNFPPPRSRLDGNKKGLRAGRPRKVLEIISEMFQIELPFED